ncbi:MAG: SBBP repeat-containing protein [Bacteroidia bacterium]|jgi:uncharacterized delta-60 repeat protein|nr:SBBP repeat-containing protein [Bacteroidia bacterium]
MHRKLPLFVLLFIFASPLFAQLNVQWVARYSTAGNNTDRARAMVLDANGNTCVTGTSWNGSNFDIVTTRFDQNGNLLWTVSFNGAGNDFDEARAITLDTSGNIIVAGTTATTVTNYDIAVIKYNPAGVLLWDTIYNGPGNNYDEPLDITTNAAGNIYLTGSSDGSGTGADLVTIAYTPAGTQLWATRYTGGGANIDAGKAITLDTAGNVYVTGTTRTNSVNNQDIITLKYNAAGVQQWFTRFNGPGSVYDEGTDIVVNDTGRVFVCGYVRALTGITNYNYITLSYTTAGTLIWQQSFNGAGNENDRANKIALTPFGKVAVTGRSLGNPSTAEDCTTILYDAATGTPVWTKTYDGNAINYDDGRNLLCDNLGNVFVTGYSFTAGQNHNYLLLEYDSLGNQILLERWNGSGNNSDQAYSIGYDTLGSVYLGGMSRGAGTGEDYAVVKFCRLAANAGTDTSVCLGGSVQLQAASSFGGIDSVWWVPAAGLNNANIANPVATPPANTCYTVFIRNIYGCINADTVCVTVFPLPGPQITANGPLSICLGDSVSLTAQDTTGGPISYVWNTGDTSQTITTGTSGTYTVTITNANTCSSQSQITVTVNPLPNVSAGNDVGFCASTTVTLCATGATDYAWSPAFGLSDTTIACPVAGPTQSTTYVVVGTDNNGCTSSDTVSITLFPFPGVPVISQNVAVLTSTPAATYQWYFNSNPIPGATQQSYTPTQNGSYYVVITDTNGCTSFSSPFNLLDVGIATNNEQAAMQIYPNPGNGSFVVQTALEGREAELLITAADGRLVHQQIIPAGSSMPLALELPNADAGLYMLMLRVNDGTVRYARLVISR